MKKYYFDKLDETIYFDQLNNGLKVYVLHRAGFQKTYATFTTKYGSIDNSFSINDDKIEVPDGIAHFLEHKMFEEEDGDIFQTFAKNSAQTNAFTTFNRTTYLFSSTSNIMKNIETLVDFVQRPYFTEENVEKEKGIIAQEIRMYEDNPDWRVYFELLRSLYKVNPIRIDIAGTTDSIYKISKEQLYICYNTFYHPSNMVLFVVSNESPEDIINLVTENQKSKHFKASPSVKRHYPVEAAELNQSNAEVRLSLSIPKVLVGFKDNDLRITGNELIKRELTTQILLEMVFGKSSELYNRLLNLDIIDEDFSYEYQIEEAQYAFSLIGGNSKNPEQLIDEIRKEINQIHNHEILSNTLFNRVKKKKIGEFLRRLNSPEYIATQFTRYIFNHAYLFDVVPLLEEITFEDVNQRFNHLNLDLMASSVIYPS